MKGTKGGVNEGQIVFKAFEDDMENENGNNQSDARGIEVRGYFVRSDVSGTAFET